MLKYDSLLSNNYRKNFFKFRQTYKKSYKKKFERQRDLSIEDASNRKAGITGASIGRYKSRMFGFINAHNTKRIRRCDEIVRVSQTFYRSVTAFDTVYAGP